MELLDLAQLAAACGGSSYIAVVAGNRTNIANIKKRLDEVIQELRELAKRHHELDKQVIVLTKLRDEANS